jgi:uncharacterized radical SAM superfamily Fe-S cluster-containing enzyme
MILKKLSDAKAAASLTMTLAGGVNESQLRPVLDLLFDTPNILSMMIQPLAFTGRGKQLKSIARRLSMPDVVDALGKAGHPAVGTGDFLPLPCSHPLCFSIAYFLKLDQGGFLSVTRIADTSIIVDILAHRTIAGLDHKAHDQIKEIIYSLWSGPAVSIPNAPAVLDTLRNLLKRMSSCCHTPRQAFQFGEQHVKSIFIHAFQDEQNFDLARVRRCCNAYPQEDGRLAPACVHNVLSRKSSRKTVTSSGTLKAM